MHATQRGQEYTLHLQNRSFLEMGIHLLVLTTSKDWELRLGFKVKVTVGFRLKVRCSFMTFRVHIGASFFWSFLFWMSFILTNILINNSTGNCQKNEVEKLCFYLMWQILLLLAPFCSPLTLPEFHNYSHNLILRCLFYTVNPLLCHSQQTFDFVRVDN